MSVIYTHILYHFYDYYLPHLMLHGCYFLYFFQKLGRARN